MLLANRKAVMATAILMSVSTQAATVVVPAGGVYKGVLFPGEIGTLTFSGDLMGALDTGKVLVSPYGAASAVILKDSDGFYTQVSASAPFTSVTVDTNSDQILGATTTGGLTQVAPVLKSVSSGGSLTVTDLNVDLVNKRVYATLIGGNGVGTLSNFYLWDFASITGSTSLFDSSVYPPTLSGLRITSEGFVKFSQALGLLPLGKAALAGVTDYGTIVATPLPEPSTYALMGLGLAGVSCLARRRSKLAE